MVYFDKSDTYSRTSLNPTCKISLSFLDYTAQLISSTPDKEGESCTGNNALLLRVLGGVMCFIIVSQSLVIAFLLLRQKRASRLGNASPPLYHLTSSLYILCRSFII